MLSRNHQHPPHGKKMEHTWKTTQWSFSHKVHMFHPAQVLHNLPQKWCKHQFKANSRYLSHSQRDTKTFSLRSLWFNVRKLPLQCIADGLSSNGWMMMDDYGCQKQWIQDSLIYVMVSPTPVKNQTCRSTCEMFPKFFSTIIERQHPKLFEHRRCDSTQPWAAKVRRVRSSWSSEFGAKELMK